MVTRCTSFDAWITQRSFSFVGGLHHFMPVWICDSAWLPLPFNFLVAITRFSLLFRDFGVPDEEASAREEICIQYLPPIILDFQLPVNYPSDDPSMFTLSCQWLNVLQVRSKPSKNERRPNLLLSTPEGEFARRCQSPLSGQKFRTFLDTCDVS